MTLPDAHPVPVFKEGETVDVEYTVTPELIVKVTSEISEGLPAEVRML